MEGLTIRRAESGDNRLLAELGAKTFRETFAQFNSPEDMSTYLAGSFGPELQSRELAESSSLFLIAESGGQPVGYARIKAGHPPDDLLPDEGGGNSIEIVRFYVDHGWHGRGVAAKMMEACLAEADLARSRLVWLAVWERNPRAITFYRKWGFTEIGSKIFQLGTDLQTDLVMVHKK